MKTSQGTDKRAVSSTKLSVFSALLMMMAFGYLLANYFAEKRDRIATASELAVNALTAENNTLTTQVNQLQAQLAILQETNDELSAAIEEYHLEQSELLDTLSLYERIIAPETTQEGFALEQLKISKAAGVNRYRMSFILLQQRQNKAVIKGDLNIVLRGSQSGRPASVEAGSAYLLPEGKLFYRFRFFQAEQVEFSLPDDFIPEFVEVETHVFQFTTLRGQYKKRFEWKLIDS
ncbi:hypothetical protein OPS25_03125 [Alteromonas ponticola]|uniref:Uncharacterized protein n=1 Tax=Alteromonas aquimaris TaxID=2998417 RepID=A0ABT3P400_9ALTE|nr:DUF6776 family protein [Alteromonas aquimaris]MCW8107495.1 hypothetical protein [Alteromonas aquimaris]